MKKTLLTIAIMAAATVSYAQKYSADWKSIDSRPVPSWFEDAKFGIFIHWGLYSVPSYSPTAREGVGVYARYAEHYWNRLEGEVKDSNNAQARKYFSEFQNRVYGPNAKYRDFVSMFKAEMFQPEQWADILENSGAKYVVLTSKHHEGFCLWPSRYSPCWNAVEVGPHRDLLGDLTAAVKGRGMKMGYYYSLEEWFHPLYNKENIDQYVEEHEMPQFKELVEKYHPDIVWPDGEWDYPSARWRSAEFLQWLYNDSPVRDSVVVNDRWGAETRGKHGGYYTTEYDLVGEESASASSFRHPWEECRGIGGSFGYNRNEILDDYSTSEELVHILINKVARGGNLLLNIGPTADGRIPVIMQQRLRDMGDWLRVNGEAIYGSRKWNAAPAITPETSVYFTSKADAVYVILTKWPEKPFKVKGIRGAKKVSMLGSDEAVRFTSGSDGITIRPCTFKSPQSVPCSYAWVYKISL